LQKIYDKYKNQGFSMVAINTIDFQKDMIPEWKAKNKFTFPILVGATETFLKENYNHQGNPTNMLVNVDGKILFRHVGYDAGAEKVIEAEIREMLGLEPFEAAPVETGQEEKASKQN
jgi:hypothetical protein